MKKILCIGDSLTEGDYGVYGKSGIANIKEKNYPYFLSQILNVPVINEGKCGFHATTYLNYYKTWQKNYEGITHIVVMLGTNGGMGIDENSQGAKDYDELINRLKSDYPEAKIAVCTAPHATEDPTKSNCGAANDVRLANEFLGKYSKEKNLPLIDTFSIPEFTTENEKTMQPNDGLHFGELGYKTMATFIANALSREFGFEIVNKV